MGGGCEGVKVDVLCLWWSVGNGIRGEKVTCLMAKGCEQSRVLLWDGVRGESVSVTCVGGLGGLDHGVEVGNIGWCGVSSRGGKNH